MMVLVRKCAGDHETGHVDVPIPCNAVKLVDVPDMGYFARDGKGEIWFRGHNVSPGYYKDPEKTAEVLDQEGWLHTVDIGMWTQAGQLKIIDRKKHLFKLAQGEYIAPEKIEAIYTDSRFIVQAFVYGEPLKSSVVAVVVPDWESLAKTAKKSIGNPRPDPTDPALHKLLLDDMHRKGNMSGLQGYEQVSLYALLCFVSYMWKNNQSFILIS